MKEYVEVPAPIPESLIIFPCEPVGVGRTVEDLANSYIDNVICIGRYKGVVRGFEEYNKTLRSLIQDRGND